MPVVQKRHVPGHFARHVRARDGVMRGKRQDEPWVAADPGILRSGFVASRDPAGIVFPGALAWSFGCGGAPALPSTANVLRSRLVPATPRRARRRPQRLRATAY